MTESQGREPTPEERELVLWLMANGNPSAASFQEQFERAIVTPWKCVCGCASIDFQVQGLPEAPPGSNILSDHVFGQGDDLYGIFLFESGGILKGLEGYGLTGAAPSFLPKPQDLRPVES